MQALLEDSTLIKAENVEYETNINNQMKSWYDILPHCNTQNFTHLINILERNLEIKTIVPRQFFFLKEVLASLGVAL